MSFPRSIFINSANNLNDFILLFLLSKGCIAIFSARHMWTVPRQVTLSKKNGEEFGFSIRGDSPVIVATIDEGSLAQVNSGWHVGQREFHKTLEHSFICKHRQIFTSLELMLFIRQEYNCKQFCYLFSMPL